MNFEEFENFEEFDDFEFIKEQEEVQADAKSKSESDYLKNDKKRQERVKNVFNTIFVCILWIAFVLICFVLTARVIHLIAPDSLRWLSVDDISQIDKFLFSSALGGIVGKYFGRMINGNS